MSVLIKELEARKDNYILVADVINALGNATNSAPDEVVKYLVGFDVDEHLTIFYMDEYYSFELYNGHILGLGNDANITYYQKSDVMAFEPITKHGIFKDVYGRTYDINQHKKNREDEYLTLAETLNFLDYNNYDYVRLRDLARRKLITPCFYFSGYVGSLVDYVSKDLRTEIITGYFTYRLLAEEICGKDEYMKLPAYESGNGVTVYRALEKQTAEYVDYDYAILFYDKPQGLDEAEKFKLTHIESEEIRFSKQELDSYIKSIAPVSVSYEPTAQNSELLTKLDTAQAENNDLNARLFTARNTYKQRQSEIEALKEQVKKANADNDDLNEQLSKANAALAATKTSQPSDELLQTILDENHEHHAPDLKYAAKLWLSLYVENLKEGEHSSKANHWLRHNTYYSYDNDTRTLGRIREIASPLHTFGVTRSREVIN